MRDPKKKEKPRTDKGHHQGGKKGEEEQEARRGSEGAEGERGSGGRGKLIDELGEIFSVDLKAEAGTVRVETVGGALENRPRVGRRRDSGRRREGRRSGGIPGRARRKESQGRRTSLLQRLRGRGVGRRVPCSCNWPRCHGRGNCDTPRAGILCPSPQSALDQMEVHRAPQMEKSQASASPEGPCGTQMSVGRQRSRPEGSGGAGGGRGFHNRQEHVVARSWVFL